MNYHYVKMIDSQIDGLTISLDAVNQKTLEQFRVGADFNKIIKNIKAVVKQRNERNSKLPKINLQFIIMKHNEHQVDEFRQLAKSLGVDTITFKAVWVTSLDEAKTFLPSNPKFHRYIMKKDSYAFKGVDTFQCKKPWSEISVNCDGSLVLCACDYNNSIILGNVNDSNVKEIINSNKALKVRGAVLKNKAMVPVCKNCAPNSNISITENL